MATNASGITAAERSMFFASPEACVASFMFEKRECANAFANAAGELRRIVGEGMDKADCKRRFHLCETESGVAQGERPNLYMPVMLGVELSNSRKGWSATPIVAVEFQSGQLQPQPISHVAAAPPETPTAVSAPPKWLSSIAAAFADEVKLAPPTNARADPLVRK